MEVAVQGSPSLAVQAYGLCGRKATFNLFSVRAQELCESRGGRPGLPVPNSPYGLCGRKATFNLFGVRAQELCVGRGGCPGLAVPSSPGLRSLRT